MKFAICNEIFQGWSPVDTFAYAHRAGYDAVEIAPFTLAKNVNSISRLQRQDLRDLAAQQNIAISGIHWVLVQTEGLFLTSPMVEIRRRTSDYFLNLVDFCADLGGRFIIVGSPKQRNLESGVSREQGIEWASEVFRDAVKLAEDRNVTICLEPLAPSETNFINTAQEAIDFVNPFRSKSFQIILDVKAMCSMSKPIPQIIEESQGQFAYFHANDANLKGPGFGEVDFHPIAKALRHVNYEGYVSVEVFKFEEGPEAIATQSREYLRKTFG